MVQVSAPDMASDCTTCGCIVGADLAFEILDLVMYRFFVGV